MTDKPNDNLDVLLRLSLSGLHEAFGRPIDNAERPPFQALRTYIVARAEAYHNRAAGQLWPWTSEPIVQRHRFTNLFREYDRESLNFINLVIKDSSLSLEDKRLNALLFRTWNRGDVFQALGGPWKTADFEEHNFADTVFKANQRLQSSKLTSYFTDAFMVSGMTRSARKNWMDHFGSLPPVPLLMFWFAREWVSLDTTISKRADEEIAKLKQIQGIGDFLAYQIWVDWTYIEGYPFSENWYTVAGPGCIQGLKILFPYWPKGATWEEGLVYLYLCQNALFQLPPETFKERKPEDQKLNLMALENIMCEFSKYMRLSQGQDIKPRRPLHQGE